MTFVGKIRLRLFVFVIGVPLAAFGAIAVGPSWAALPVVGMAFYALSVSVNKAASRLAKPTCWTCGQDLSGRANGPYGIDCPGCGTLNTPLRMAPSDEAPAEAPDEWPSA